MNNQRKLRRGFTLVEIMIVVAIIGLLAAIAIPNFVRARVNAQKNACINNLRLLDASKQQWALEKKQSASALPLESDLAPYLGRDAIATAIKSACPADPTGQFGNSYAINPVDTPAGCNIVPLTHKIE